MTSRGTGNTKTPEGSAGGCRNDNSNPQQGSGSTAKMIPASASSDEGTIAKISNVRTNSKTPPNKKDSRKLFVGGLPSDVTEKEFNDFFAQYGIVLDSVVMYDRETQRSRGFGFVTFQDPEVANRLLNMGENSKEKSLMPDQPRVGRLEMRGKTCEVKAAEPKETRPNRRSYAPSATAFPNSGAGAGFVDRLSHRKLVSHEDVPPASISVDGSTVGSTRAASSCDDVSNGGGGGVPVLASAQPAAPAGYHHHFPQDINGTGPDIHGASFYPALVGFPAVQGGRHVGPMYNPMVPLPHHGEMMPHHPGVATPFVGHHMDGAGYVDFPMEAYHGYHHPPPHHHVPPHQHPHWFMMQQQPHVHQPPIHQQHALQAPIPPPSGPPPNGPHAIYNNNMNNMPYPVSAGTAPSAVMQRTPPGGNGKPVQKDENGSSSA